jgi:hypothetical protein
LPTQSHHTTRPLRNQRRSLPRFMSQTLVTLHIPPKENHLVRRYGVYSSRGRGTWKDRPALRTRAPERRYGRAQIPAGEPASVEVGAVLVRLSRAGWRDRRAAVTLPIRFSGSDTTGRVTWRTRRLGRLPGYSEYPRRAVSGKCGPLENAAAHGASEGRACGTRAADRTMFRVISARSNQFLVILYPENTRYSMPPSFTT